MPLLTQVFPCPGSVHFDGTDDDHLHGRRLLRLCLLGRLNTLQHSDGCVGSRLRHCACETAGANAAWVRCTFCSNAMHRHSRLTRTAGPYGNGWQPAQVPRWVISMANVAVFLRTVPAYQIYRWARQVALQCSIPTDDEQSAGWMLSVTGAIAALQPALWPTTPAPTLLPPSQHPLPVPGGGAAAALAPLARLAHRSAPAPHLALHICGPHHSEMVLLQTVLLPPFVLRKPCWHTPSAAAKHICPCPRSQPCSLWPASCHSSTSSPVSGRVGGWDGCRHA